MFRLGVLCDDTILCKALTGRRQNMCGVRNMKSLRRCQGFVSLGWEVKRRNP